MITKEIISMMISRISSWTSHLLDFYWNQAKHQDYKIYDF